MIIVPPARLIVCEFCGQHGYIIFSNGSQSEDVHSVLAALALVYRSVQNGLMLDVEVEHIKQRIIDSDFPFESLKIRDVEGLSSMNDRHHLN